MMNKLRLKGDNFIPLTVIFLACFGIVAVYSASGYVAESDYGNPFYYAIKQGAGVAVGILAMIFTANYDYRNYLGKTKWMYIFGVILLALCFLPFLSVEVYGAKRWINLGFFTLQSSEVAKFCYIFFLAEYFSADTSRARSFKGVIIPLLTGILVCVLIILEPNMSITVCVGLVMLAMLFLAGMKIKHFVLVLLPCVALIPVLIILEPYRLKRLSAFLNPWENPKGEGYQLLQSLYGLGSGGLFGVGLFNSRQKYRFLPFSESDFILSVIGEETGFFGTAVLFGIMVFLIMKGVRTAISSSDFFGYMLSMGITTMYAVQVFVNALVVTGSIPPTGLPLPLISAGNTSIIVFMAAFGVVYNISKVSKTASLDRSLKPFKVKFPFKKGQKPDLTSDLTSDGNGNNNSALT